MSKFEILKSKGKSLYTLAVLNKLIYILFCLIFPVLALTGPIVTRLGYGDNIIVITLILWIIIMTGLVVLARIINNNVVKHGELLLTGKGFKKSISGLTEFITYDEIKEIKIRKHIRNIFYSSNNDSSKTYLVTIITDTKTERFVTSSQSCDYPDTNLKDFFRKLEKHTGRKVNLT